MNFRKHLLLFTLVLSVFSASNAFAAADGKAIFKANCSACHKVTSEKVNGPGLEGIAGRVPSPAKDWLTKWVKNNIKLRESGDAYAVKVYNDNNKGAMPAFEYLSDEELNAVVDYIIAPPKEEPKAGAPVAAAEQKAAPQDDNTVTYILLGLSLLFILVFLFTGRIKHNLETVIAEKEGTTPPELHEGMDGVRYWMANNKKLVAVGGFLAVLWVFKLGWDAMMGVGVYVGYQPEQPIKFSHELHAGVNKINCQYCHSGAERSKHAGIPSANVCMNCHKAITSGPNTGKTEIAKIYEALDYNPATQSYGPNQKPIKWIKVHTLPDHVYFNHQQHVSVGKVECKTCHGAVDSMAVVSQHAPLTMGWCVNCHRETQVTMTGNPYYDDIKHRFNKYLKANNQKSLDRMEKVTVETMGGTECSKCHY